MACPLLLLLQADARQATDVGLARHDARDAGLIRSDDILTSFQWRKILADSTDSTELQIRQIHVRVISVGFCVWSWRELNSS